MTLTEIRLFVFVWILISSTAYGQSREKRGFKDPSPSKDSSISGVSKSQFLDLVKRLSALESNFTILARANEQSNGNITSLVQVVQALPSSFGNVSKVVPDNANDLKLLSDKVKDLESYSSYDENYWNRSDVCGGILVGQAGIISFRTSYSMDKEPRCVWTVRANYRSKVRLTTSALDSTTIDAHVTEFFINENGTSNSKTTVLASLTTYILQGPVVIISTSSLVSFTISYEGVGKFIHQDTLFRHHHFTDLNGTFTVKNLSDANSSNDLKKFFTTFVINTETRNVLKLEVDVPKTCGNTSVLVQSTGESQNATGSDSTCCTSPTSNCTLTRYTVDDYFIISHSSLQEKSELDIKWSTIRQQSSSLNQCGGILMGKSGIITYKRFETYKSNERCVWVIFPFPKRAVKITEIANNLETTYDHVSIIEIDRPDELFHTHVLSPITSSITNYTGRVILVTFYSDSSIVRQGFALSWKGIGPSDLSRDLENEKIHHSSKDDSGVISVSGEGFLLYTATNIGQDGSSLNMTLTKKSGANCTNSRLGIFGSTSGEVSAQSRMLNICDDTETHHLRSLDGIGGVIVENKDSNAAVSVEMQLKFVPLPPSDQVKKDKCGGILHGSGRFNYKVESVYDNNERCIWLIHSPTATSITLRILKNGFESCCDYLLINTVNPNTGQINEVTTALTHESPAGTFQSPLLIVTFRSDGSVAGKGFLLHYTGYGGVNNVPTYRLAHSDDLAGTFSYPSSIISPDEADEEWGSLDDATDATVFRSRMMKNEIVIFAYSGVTEVEEGAMVYFNVTVEDSNFGVNDNCQKDSLKFYTNPSREGFVLAESYPKEICRKSLTTGLCENCQRSKLSENDTTPNTFGSNFRAFVAIYKPTITLKQNQSFDLRWDSSAGCGGVLYPDERRISYKLGTKYKNLEQCIWTVHILDASKIRFELSSNGFEQCCDNVILTPLNSETGSLGSSVVLRSDNPLATVDGPVVFVTFRSDASVTGNGFALNFAPIVLRNSSSILTGTNSTSTSEDEFTYYHYSSGRHNSSFEFPTGPKRNLEVGANVISTFTFTPDPSKNDSLLRFGNSITLEKLNLFADNETCTSDSISFYETLSRSGYNRSRTFNINIPDRSSCNDAAADGRWECQGCLANATRTDQLEFPTSLPAFIVIYKSNTQPEQDPSKGYKISWVDRKSSPETVATTTRRYNYYG